MAFLLACVFLAPVAQGQRIQYSRSTVRSTFADAVELVANVDSYHHLLFLSVDKKPIVYVFDAKLQLVGKEELDAKLKANTDIRVLSLGKRYVLYLHVPGTLYHRMFSIEGDGEATDVSSVFSNPADTAWNRSLATFQLFNRENKLGLFNHTYFDAIKKIGSRVVWFNDDLTQSRLQNVFFPFDGKIERLQEALFYGNDMFLLKSGRQDKGSFLDVVKIETETGKTTVNSFTSDTHIYATSGIRFGEADSSLLIYSLLRTPPASGPSSRSVFLSRLDYSLQEKNDPVILQSQFRNNAATFLLVNTPQPFWLSLSTSFQIRRSDNRVITPQPFDMEERPVVNVTGGRSFGYTPYLYSNLPSSVRLSVLDKVFKKVKDSVIANNNANYYDVQPQPYAQFQTKGKAWLLLIENFSQKQSGLVLFSNDQEGGLSTTNLAVYDRYDYFLQQLKLVGNDYFVLPYNYKNEFGLVKIQLVE